ncbi:hypothetical protein [uncultured Porphyromonas sp.]|nr:hypothetical protein [uncultured Porphyromonas sp.]
MNIRLPYLTTSSLSRALEDATKARQSAHHQQVMEQLLALAKQ